MAMSSRTRWLLSGLCHRYLANFSFGRMTVVMVLGGGGGGIGRLPGSLISEILMTLTRIGGILAY